MYGSADPAVVVVHEFVGGSKTLGDALEAIATLATSAVGADRAGLTLLAINGRPTTVAQTDAGVADVDGAQYDSDRGPCLEAFRQLRTVSVPDTAAETRWPEFDAAARAHGIGSSLSLPIVVGARGVGALNLYAGRPGSFDDESAAIGTLYARHAATVAAYYDRAEDADNLQRALDSRAQIEQAKGVLMSTTGCDPDHAFDLLRAQSQNENRKLRDIAAELVDRQRRTTA